MSHAQLHGLKEDAGQERLSEKETRDLVAGVKRGDRDAAEVLLSVNMNLIYAIVHKIDHRDKLDFEDLVQEGCMAFMKAVKKFRPDGNAKLTTYATTVIEHHLWDIVLEQSDLIHVSKYIREKREDGYPQAYLTLDRPRYDDGGDWLESCGDKTNPETLFYIHATREAVREYLRELPERTRTMLKLYYGFFGEGRTMEQIGSYYGISRSAVHGRIRQGLDRLKTMFTEWSDPRTSCFAPSTKNFLKT